MTCEELESHMMEMANRIQAPINLLPLICVETFDGSFIRIEGTYWKTYRLVYMERGLEVDFAVAATVDDLMYAVFRKVAHTIAFDWEARHRKSVLDSRRQAFDKMLDILNILSPQYKKREQIEIQRILNIAPYKD